eukprot:COSAG01_NODE_1017_length_12107_cov_114.566372_5_plen_65_part_00
MEIRTEFNCAPGLVVIARGPTQEPNCRVTFVIEMQVGVMSCHRVSSGFGYGTPALITKLKVSPS